MEAGLFTVVVPDGRRVEVAAAGPPRGRVLVFHNGTPGGPVIPPSLAAAAAERGLRAIICARPGYGRSDPLPGRRVADVAGDVSAVLNELGVGEFVTVGWSGGGPHALACAARLPGRCVAAASLAGVAPYQAEGLDWLAGMGPENIEEFTAAAAGEAALTGFLGNAADGLAQIEGAQLAEGLGGLISAVDKAVLTGEFADFLAASMRAAVGSGTAGWRDDDLAFAAHWGFSPEEAGVTPVAIWQGDQDRMVPWAHGEWLAARVPGARAHLLPGEGHLTLPARRYGAILDDLLELAGWSLPAHAPVTGDFPATPE